MPETPKISSMKKPSNGPKNLVGLVVSTKMTKTIVVQVERQRAHPLYRRVVSRSKKFYAHDEQETAHVGDSVRIEETRPLSRLKRWKLKEIVKRSALAPETGKEPKGEA